MKYIAYTESHGRKPVAGDYVTFDMVYKTEDDSILFDSRQNQSPFRIQLENIPFKGSLEEGLTCISEGDSATFFISADSLLKYVIRKEEASATLLKPGTKALFDIRLHRVQSQADALKEIAQKAAERQEAELKSIRGFLEREKYTALPDSNGLYIIGSEPSGKNILDGDTVSVYYTGKYLNGIPFETKSKPGDPLQFVMGAGHVIPGWEIAFKSLHEHSRVTLVIPSSLAYGRDGLFNPSQGNYIVPPYTPLTYDIEVVRVKR
jgi:FKBP-type peptidyl-prolyl cis-trans isomerase